MDHDIKVLIWSIIGYDEFDFDGFEQNALQLENIPWNVILVDVSDWYVKEWNVLQC